MEPLGAVSNVWCIIVFALIPLPLRYYFRHLKTRSGLKARGVCVPVCTWKAREAVITRLEELSAPPTVTDVARYFEYVWCGMVLYCMVWYGMVLYVIVWYGMM